ncbi:MAG: TolC family protein [Clostridium sp.]|nr:TolC family protein [Clostridium sp.]
MNWTLFKKPLGLLFAFLMFFMNSGFVYASQSAVVARNIKERSIVYKPNARAIKYAFVFDGPSDKNNAVLSQFKNAITHSTAPDYKAEFPTNLVFVGNWTKEGVKSVSDKAMQSDAAMIVSLGYLTSKYYNSIKDKKKFVVTIDQYGLRDLGEGFFNPVQQSVKGVYAFKKLVNFNKTAILMNENYYKTRNDWHKFLEPKLEGIDFVIVPATKNIDKTFDNIPKDVDAVVLTPLFNLSVEERKHLIRHLNELKIPAFSTLGKEDVELGVLLGSGAYDLDRKVAEATSFNIKGALKGEVKKTEKIQFYEDEVFYINSDTSEEIGFEPHLRIMNNAEIITYKKLPVYDLSAIFNTLEKQNLDIERKRLLVKAAKRSAVSAALRYLPTFGVTLGYQQYNSEYADSARLLYPEKTGVFQLGLEQVIYSPALVTNILVQKKKFDFQKHEQFLTEQNMGIDIATIYIDALMLKNAIEIQKEYVKESREILAMARVRQQMGKCGQEETMRWASQLNINEQKLLDMNAEYKNLKIAINKLLYNKQTDDFELAPLTAMDPAFYTKDINIIDYVSTPQALEKFTVMLRDRAFEVAPELSKLKAAIKMKDYERNMYYQKFILPDAKLTYTYTSLMNREFTRPMAVALPVPGIAPVIIPNANATNGQLGIFAQWKPFEGGTKIAEIMRIDAEKKELLRYQDEAKTEIELQIRDIINRAIASYFSIEKNYKAMYASEENYREVKKNYLTSDVPIAQLVDAQHIYLDSKLAAMNSQNKFFQQLVWVQRAICAVNWSTADEDSKKFIQSVKDNLEKRGDITL